MTADDRVDADGQAPPARALPPSVPAAQAALEAITAALATAETPGARAGAAGQGGVPGRAGTRGTAAAPADQERLAGWETRLIEAARHAGASWTDLAAPLGVASGRPRSAVTCGCARALPVPPASSASRPPATGGRPTAGSPPGPVTTPRACASSPEQLSALDDLPDETRTLLGRALGDHDPAALLAPLADARAHLDGGHAELRGRLDAVSEHTTGLRRPPAMRRGPGGRHGAARRPHRKAAVARPAAAARTDRSDTRGGPALRDQCRDQGRSRRRHRPRGPPRKA